MTENIPSDVETVRFPDTGNPQVDALVAWFRENYDQIADCAERKGLPKPPHW